MKKIDKKCLIDKVEKTYELAERSFRSNNGKKALEYIKIIARWLYNYNITYKDDRLEKLLCQLSSEITVPSFIKDNRRITFLDSFAMDNRGLSLIYVRALIKLGYDIQYITYCSKDDKMPRIRKELTKNSNNEIVYLKEMELETSQKIVNSISRFGAKKILMHITPWDTCCLVALYALENQVERYMINITDHAFWLGKDCLDYSIEFRNYGYSISKRERNIPENKLLILPYYPAKTEKAFQGFPFETENKKIIFSGGSLYKTSGSPIFWDTIRYILDNYEDTIFLYAGNGNTNEMEEFIKDNRFEKRFFLIRERLDLDEIMKRCYFYLSTYPICGGLMAQYAVANGKIPVTYADGNDLSNEVDGLFINTNGKKLSFNDWKDMLQEIDKMLLDEEYLKKRETQWMKYLPTEKEFTEQLHLLLENHQTRYEKKMLDIDIYKFSDFYFKSRENTYFNFIKPILKTKNISICIHFGKEIYEGMISYLHMKRKR